MELAVAPVTELRGLLTQSFEEWAREANADSSATASCAFSGGGSALIFLGALRGANVDWTRISVFWSDELAVAADDPDSHYGIANRMLFAPLGALAPRTFRMPAELPNLGEAAERYDAALASELHGGVLDLAILGVGEDGHICALFPGHPALTVDDMRVAAVEGAPRPPARRLTLSLPFVMQTRKIWLIAIGPRKLPVLQAALRRTRRDTPVDLVLQEAKDVTVFTDQVIRRP